MNAEAVVVWEVVWVEGSRARIQRKLGKLEFRITVDLGERSQGARRGDVVETDHLDRVLRVYSLDALGVRDG